MRKTADEIITAIKTILGDNATSDEAISLLEDIADSVDSDGNMKIAELENTIETIKRDNEEAYNSLDNEWRKKYIERFNSGEDNTVVEKETEEIEIKNYDDLFKEV